MFQRLRDRLTGRRDRLPAPDRLRLLLYVWRSAIERDDVPMAARAWDALREEARLARADDVLAAMAILEQHHASDAVRASASTTLQFAVARFAAGGDPAVSTRFVIQDLALAAEANYRTTHITEYLAKLRAIRTAADRTGFHDIRDGADALLRDHERLAIWQAGRGQAEIAPVERDALEQMARDHVARISALTAAAWRGYGDFAR